MFISCLIREACIYYSILPLLRLRCQTILIYQAPKRTFLKELHRAKLDISKLLNHCHRRLVYTINKPGYLQIILMIFFSQFFAETPGRRQIITIGATSPLVFLFNQNSYSCKIAFKQLSFPFDVLHYSLTRRIELADIFRNKPLICLSCCRKQERISIGIGQERWIFICLPVWVAGTCCYMISTPL